MTTSSFVTHNLDVPSADSRLDALIGILADEGAHPMENLHQIDMTVLLAVEEGGPNELHILNFISLQEAINRRLPPSWIPPKYQRSFRLLATALVNPSMFKERLLPPNAPADNNYITMRRELWAILIARHRAEVLT
jgi:hypothetical protein